MGSLPLYPEVVLSLILAEGSKQMCTWIRLKTECAVNGYVVHIYRRGSNRTSGLGATATSGPNSQ